MRTSVCLKETLLLQVVNTKKNENKNKGGTKMFKRNEILIEDFLRKNINMK